MDNTQERLKLIHAALAESWDEKGYENSSLNAEDAWWLTRRVDELLEENKKKEKEIQMLYGKLNGILDILADTRKEVMAVEK